MVVNISYAIPVTSPYRPVLLLHTIVMANSTLTTPLTKCLIMLCCPAVTLGHYKLHTVNREYFVVKIFSDSLACAKIKRTKIHAQD